MWLPPLIPVGTECPASCEYAGQRVAFTYRTIAPTEALGIQQRTAGDAHAFGVALAAATVVWWDLPEPPSAEALAKQDPDFLIALLGAASADLAARMGQAARGGELHA